MFDGLYLSILSILKRTKSTINFYFLSGDLTELKDSYHSLTLKHKTILTKLVRKYNKNNSFIEIDCSKVFWKYVGKTEINLNHWTPYTLFRLLISDLDFKGKVLYLDGDMLINGDISKAFEEDISMYEICVCHDVTKLKTRKRWFNAGSILINTSMIRKTNLFKKAFKYSIEEQPSFFDQDALNILAKKVKFWKDEYRFNYQPNLFLRNILYKNVDPIEPPIIYHFFGISPWFKKPWSKGFLTMAKRKRINFWEEDLKDWHKMKISIGEEKK